MEIPGLICVNRIVVENASNWICFSEADQEPGKKGPRNMEALYLPAFFDLWVSEQGHSHQHLATPLTTSATAPINIKFTKGSLT